MGAARNYWEAGWVLKSPHVKDTQSGWKAKGFQAAPLAAKTSRINVPRMALCKGVGASLCPLFAEDTELHGVSKNQTQLSNWTTKTELRSTVTQPESMCPGCLKESQWVSSLVIQWLRFRLPVQGVQVWSLVRKLLKRCGFDPWLGKIPWRRAWQPTEIFLPGESHGQRRLEGYSL